MVSGRLLVDDKAITSVHRFPWLRHSVGFPTCLCDPVICPRNNKKLRNSKTVSHWFKSSTESYEGSLRRSAFITFASDLFITHFLSRFPKPRHPVDFPLFFHFTLKRLKLILKLFCPSLNPRAQLLCRLGIFGLGLVSVQPFSVHFLSSPRQPSHILSVSVVHALVDAFAGVAATISCRMHVRLVRSLTRSLASSLFDSHARTLRYRTSAAFKEPQRVSYIRSYAVGIRQIRSKRLTTLPNRPYPRPHTSPFILHRRYEHIHMVSTITRDSYALRTHSLMPFIVPYPSFYPHSHCLPISTHT